MSGFTIKDLKDIEDSASERAPGIEGRLACSRARRRKSRSNP